MKTPTYTPVKTIEVEHSISLAGTDVDVTMFVEYFNEVWIKQWHTLLNISNISYDLGSDELRFVTRSGKISLLNFVRQFSIKFDRMYFTYHYFTVDSDEEEQEIIQVHNGEEVQL